MLRHWQCYGTDKLLGKLPQIATDCRRLRSRDVMLYKTSSGTTCPPLSFSLALDPYL